jgi:predicted RNA-binding protein (virulence factor B family)
VVSEALGNGVNYSRQVLRHEAPTTLNLVVEGQIVAKVARTFRIGVVFYGRTEILGEFHYTEILGEFRYGELLINAVLYFDPSFIIISSSSPLWQPDSCPW